MFRSSRKSLKVCYYISSLLPVYTFILIFMIVIRIKLNKKYILDHVLNMLKIYSTYKLTFCIFLILLIVSLCCLFETKHIIDETKNYSKTLGMSKAEFKDQYNPGFREFILSVILPMMSTFSVDDYPLATLVMVMALQLFIFVFFLNSSDFFPNLSLFLLGYSVFIVDKTNYPNSKLKYAFGKTSNIDSIIKDSQPFMVIEIGEPDYYNNVGVIYERK